MSNLNFLMVSAFLFLNACVQPGPQLTPQQRRALQVKTYDTSYDNVFKAIKTVFQDEGYIVKNQDFAGGLILAQKETTAGAGNAFWAAMAGDKNYVTGTGFEISANMEAINKNTTEVRLILQSKTTTSLGGSAGRELLQPEVYRAIFEKIVVEIERRKARGM